MSHGTAGSERQVFVSQSTDGLGTRLVGARLVELARLASAMHASELALDDRGRRGEGHERRVLRHEAFAGGAGAR